MFFLRPFAARSTAAYRLPGRNSSIRWRTAEAGRARTGRADRRERQPRGRTAPRAPQSMPVTGPLGLSIDRPGRRVRRGRRRCCPSSITGPGITAETPAAAIAALAPGAGGRGARRRGGRRPPPPSPPPQRPPPAAATRPSPPAAKRPSRPTPKKTEATGKPRRGPRSTRAARARRTRSSGWSTSSAVRPAAARSRSTPSCARRSGCTCRSWAPTEPLHQPRQRRRPGLRRSGAAAQGYTDAGGENVARGQRDAAESWTAG